MKTTSSSEHGFLNARLFLALALCLGSAGLAWFSFASTPSTGTITDSSGPIVYDAGPFLQPNQSPVGLGQLDTGPRCDDGPGAFPCDSYVLTVNLPSGYAAAHCNAAVQVTAGWTDTGTGKSDYDLYVYRGVVPSLDGSTPADYQSATGHDPEVASVGPLTDGVSTFTVKIVPFQPTGETLHVKVELLPGTGSCGTPGFGGADATAPGRPRFQIFKAPAGTSAESGSGEFNIGFNPHTGRIMTMNSGPIWRVTPPEVMVPAKPECCEALWEDKSSTVTNTGLDPILWTDQKSGRTFASNSTVGANAVYAYSDSDGEPTVTAPTGWIPFGIAAPNGGADHETIGTGPYPLIPNPIPGGSPLPNPLGNAANQGEAVYYCSQDIVGPAACYRSDTLGVSYGPSVLAYTGQGPGFPGGICGGLHGHLHVAPDGTAWLPVSQCSGLQGGVFSTDSGQTWNTFQVPNGFSQAEGADPSIAIDSDSTIYYAYVKAEPVTPGNPLEGHAHVAVGHRNADNTITWIRDIDIGASHGIVNAAEIEAVGGSSGRAAVAFLGTDRPGDYQALHFPGKWYPFIATTYDGGATWTMVNATPNDPVQSESGIWQQGGGKIQRNLLDFTEITIDDKGRVLYGFSDGCVTPDCIGGTAQNDFVAYMRVARQSGGKTLFASYDGQTDTTTARAPKGACLSGTRDSLASHLDWRVPDNGGNNIVRYEIWRGTTSGGESLLFTTNDDKPAFVDTSASASTPDYYYYVKAINSAGTGVSSNEIHLTIAPIPLPESFCTLPGLTKLTDPAGDTSATIINFTSTPAAPGSDLLSFQLGQPQQNDGVPRLYFTINTDANPTNTGTPGSAWYVAMRIPGPDPDVAGDTSDVHYRGVHMAFNNSNTPVFESYTPSGNQSGGVDGRFVNPGSQKPAEASSNYDGPNGKITIIMKASDLGLKPGDQISGFIAGVSQTTDPLNIGVGATALYDQMPDSLSFANSYTVAHNNTCAVLPPGIVSRKIHGDAGPFDLGLPSSGTPSIECRTGGSAGSYTLIYTFGANVRFAGAPTISSGTATASNPVVGPNLNQVTVNLTGVSNAQHLVVDLNGAQDTGNVSLGNMSAHMDVLVGDTTANGAVNSSDISQTQGESGHDITSANFREDVTANGAINSSDIATVQGASGTALPAAPNGTTTTNPASTAPPTKKAKHKTRLGKENSF